MEESDSTVIAASLEAPEVFGVLFDRHGVALLRFLARRVHPSEAEGLLGEVFRVAFERRERFELDRESARPWLYGIAANVVAKHQRSEARRLRATVRVAARRSPAVDLDEQTASALDARTRWSWVADTISGLPAPEREVSLVERREARMEMPDGMLAWLEIGDGVVMIGGAGEDHHDLHSPLEVGFPTAMINVYVADVDAHHRRAKREGARIVMDLEDMFWGDRRYEALDPEGHRWHFAQRLSEIQR